MRDFADELLVVGVHSHVDRAEDEILFQQRNTIIQLSRHRKEDMNYFVPHLDIGVVHGNLRARDISLYHLICLKDEVNRADEAIC